MASVGHGLEERGNESVRMVEGGNGFGASQRKCGGVHCWLIMVGGTYESWVKSRSCKRC